MPPADAAPTQMEEELRPDWLPPKRVRAPSGSASGAAGSAGRPNAKQQKIWEDSEGKVTQKSILKVLLKLSLQSANTLRDIMGSEWTTLLVPIDGEVYKALEATGQWYRNQSKDQDKKYKMEPPFFFTWATLVEALSEDDKVEATTKAHLAHYFREVLSKQDRATTAFIVRHCRLYKHNKNDKKKASRQNKAKLSISIMDTPLHTAVVAALLNTGAELVHGPPPRSALERVAQSMLEELE